MGLLVVVYFSRKCNFSAHFPSVVHKTLAGFKDQKRKDKSSYFFSIQTWLQVVETLSHDGKFFVLRRLLMSIFTCVDIGICGNAFSRDFCIVFWVH